MLGYIQKIHQKLDNKFINPIRFNHLRPVLKCNTSWYGNYYGGFSLNPDLLNENSVIYSFGIGEDISFDRELIETHHCQVYAFDPTPKSIAWCTTQELPENFHFYDFGISSKSGKAGFYLPKNKDHVSGSLILQDNVSKENKVLLEMKTLKDISEFLQHSKIDVLKMDIEGSEYNVIDSILNSGIAIDQLAIELHERFFENGKKKSIRLVQTLKKHGYEIFAVHKSYEEVSFIRTEVLGR